MKPWEKYATSEDSNNAAPWLKYAPSQQEQVQQPQESPSLLKQAGQFAMGLPQGLGNKFVGGVQTATNALGFSDSQFAKNLANNVAELKQKQSELPIAERAGITGGEIATDLAVTKGKNLATSGAIAGLTTPLEDSSTGARLSQVGQDAALSSVFGKGTEAVSKLIGKGTEIAKEGVENIYKGLKARTPEELKAVGQAIKDKSSALYQAVKDSGTVLRPQATGAIVRSLEKSLSKEGDVITSHLHGDTLKTLQVIKDDIAKKEGLISLPELDQYRQLLNQTIKKNTSKIDGANPDAQKAIVVKTELDKVVQNLKPKYLLKSGNPEAVKMLDEARGEWARASKFERVSDIVERADGDPNKIKTLLGNFIKNKNNLRGYSDEEKAVLKRAAESSVGEKLLKMSGKLGVDTNASLASSGSVLPIAELYFGGLATGGAGVALGTIAKSAQKYIARGKLDDALKVIQSSGNPAKTISSIPNRKMQEKILNHLIKGVAVGSAELNQGGKIISDANAQDLTEDQSMALYNQESKKYPGIYANTSPQEERKMLEQRYFRKGS